MSVLLRLCTWAKALYFGLNGVGPAQPRALIAMFSNLPSGVDPANMTKKGRDYILSFIKFDEQAIINDAISPFQAETS